MPLSTKDLYIFAHPDDETFIAGSMAMALKSGIEVHGLWMTSGDYFGGGERRRVEHAKAMEILGLEGSNTEICDYPDLGLMYNLEGCIKKISRVIEEIKPHRVFTTAYEGGHPDHDSTNLACFMALADIDADISMLEIPLYNGSGPSKHFKWRINSFPLDNERVLYQPLDNGSIRIKHRMIKAYSSQWMYMIPLRLACGTERMKNIGEPYSEVPKDRDYTRPPHWRPLNYERFFNSFMRVDFDLFKHYAEKVLS